MTALIRSPSGALQRGVTYMDASRAADRVRDRSPGGALKSLRRPAGWLGVAVFCFASSAHGQSNSLDRPMELPVLPPICMPEFAPDADRAYVEAILGRIRGARAAQLGLPPGSAPFFNLSRWPGNVTDPITLTWSLVPDGTQADGPYVSNLYSTMNLQFGGQSWIAKFAEFFARWDELTGIRFQRVIANPATGADDGAPWGNPSVPGVRGDIRIFMHNIDGAYNPGAGSGFIFAMAQFPTWFSEGDITLDSAENWFWTPPWAQGELFQLTVMHEIGHAVGLDHVCPNDFSIEGKTKLMEPWSWPTIQFYGPQHDDVRAAQAYYGDPYEPNDTGESAWHIDVPPDGVNRNYGAVSEPYGNLDYGPGNIKSGKISIDAPDDVDYFTFTLAQPTALLIDLAPVGLTYKSYPDTCPPSGFDCCDGLPNVFSDRVCALRIDVLDRTLTQIESHQTTLGNHVPFNIALMVVNKPYYLRITPIGSAFDSPQPYDLKIQSSPGPGCGSQGDCNDGIAANGVEACVSGGCYVSALCETCDCNGNYWEDWSDIASGRSHDCNGNGVPDECETDCNGNGFADSCDIANGTSQDHDGNGVPDECQDDCNGNHVPDAYDLSHGTSQDSNLNGVPDECETLRRVPLDFITIADALAVSHNGDTIQVAPGVYSGPASKNLQIIDKTIQLVSEGGPYATTIDLQGSGRLANIASHTKPNKTAVRGFRIRNGNATGGGALYIDGADAQVERCIFEASSATYAGGAIAIRGGSAGLVRPKIVSSVFYGNTAARGGAVSISAYVFPSYFAVAPKLINCTFASNTASADGGAVAVLDDVAAGTLDSCIVWLNQPSTSSISEPASRLAVKYCDLPQVEWLRYSGPLFPGNISLDPVFRNVSSNDYRIRSNSPCRNTGNPAYHPVNTFDIEGDQRVLEGVVDIGADEFDPTVNPRTPSGP